MIAFWNDLTLFWKIVKVCYVTSFPLMLWRRTTNIAGLIGGIAFGAIIGYVAGGFVFEALVRLVVTAGPSPDDLGNTTYTSVAEYQHRLAAAWDTGSWNGAAVGGVVGGIKAKQVWERNRSVERNAQAR